MIKLNTKMSTLPALIAGLMITAPVAEASVEGATLTFSPGKGLKPLVEMARGTASPGQPVMTGASEVREMLFPDGTSVTLGPGSEVTVEAFDYSESTGSGQLVLRVNRGLVRVAGGALSERTPIIVKTATGEVRLDAASAIVEANAEGRTRASLLAGRGVELQSGGQVQSVQKPGFQLVSMSGQAAPDGPSHQPDGAAAADAFGLGTAQLSGLTQQQEDQLGRVGQTELAAAGAATLALATETRQPGSLVPPAVAGFTDIDSVEGGGASEGFGVGPALSAVDTNGERPTRTTSGLRGATQSREGNVLSPSRTIDAIRSRGLTTNRIYAAGFTQSNVESALPVAATSPTGSNYGDPTKIEYLFLNGLDLSLVVDYFKPDGEGGLSAAKWPGSPDVRGGFTTIPEAPLIVRFSPDQLANGQITSGVTNENRDSGHKLREGSLLGLVSFRVLQTGFSAVAPSDLPEATEDQRIIKKNAIATGIQNVVMRNADNFLMVEAKPVDGKSGDFIFATGNVDAGRIIDGKDNPNFKNTFAVDRFFISAGLDNFDQKDQGRTVASDIRAFLRNETAGNLNLTDSGLFVINTDSKANSAQNAFLHADFGMQGDGASQQSTLSVTIGGIKYSLDKCGTCQIRTYDVNANGVTVGSSRITNKDGRIGTVAISSPLINTSAGGGNPQLQRDGYAGYFVFENYTPASDRGFTEALDGGKEHAVGNVSSDVQYAALRLATATGQVSVASRSDNVLTGWVGGLAEKENGTTGLTISPVSSGTDPNNFTIRTDPANNRVQADVRLTSQNLILGGPSNPSAMIDDARFAAANNSVAMVNANVLRDNNGNLPASLNMPGGQPIPKYEYLQWGFIFGDTAGTPGSNLEHLHMGTWVAGKPSDPDQLPTTGVAQYAGHAIGNVANGASLYTAVGSYANTWDFAKRAGTSNINFDGAHYSGTTQLANGAAVFQGAMTAADAARQGSQIGNFVQGPGDQAAGMAGRFVIKENSGAQPYRASGTFGAQRVR